MEKINLLSLARTYANNGQHAEQVVRYTLTGEIVKADNIPATQGGDLGDIQIKSARATVCKGNDLDAYLQEDKANRYAYVTDDFKTAYIMSKDAWRDFVKAFGTLTRESHKNGGKEKIRLKHESKEMREWLERA
jgi:hypothetical protein